MSKGYKKLVLPALDCDPSELLAYRDDAFGDRNTLRCRKLENAARNLLYFYGKQWIELDPQMLVNGARGYSFREMQTSSREIPKPTGNLISGAVDIEMAALGRRQLTAKVMPISRDPRSEAAAQVAEDILQDRLQKLHWADIREHFTFLTIVTSMGILKSYWDESYADLGYYDNPEAKHCSTCGFQAAAPEGELCPYCQEQGIEHPLEPLELTPELAQQTDSLGQPLGLTRPKGQTAIEVVSPFDFYPENSGIDQDWNSIKTWRQATPRSLDWIFERFPELEGKLEPESPRELMKNHPVLGEWDIIGRYNEGMDADLFANHAMVYETYQEKSGRYPDGRAVVVVGDEVAKNSTLYVDALGTTAEGKPKKVKLVCFAGANWEPKHREIWGKSLVDDLISPQNVYNGLSSLELESIARTGSPNIILPEGSSADGPEFFEPYDQVGKIIRYRVDPLNPAAKPEILGGVVTPPGVGQAKNEALQLIQMLQGPASIEVGEAPRNITTTSGLQLLGEQAEKRRGYRERSLVSAFEKIWSHQLELLSSLRVDPDTYEATLDDGSWEQREYNMQSIAGQINVKIEKTAEVDKSLYTKEAVREAMADGLYGPVDLLSPIAKAKILKLRGLPSDVVEDKNRQIDLVKRRWADFLDFSTVPTVDPTIDDPQIQFAGLASYLLSNEGIQLAEAANWAGILKLISGWEARLMQIEAADQAARALYGTDNPQVAQPMYEQLQAQFEQSQLEYEQASQDAEKLVQQGGMPQTQLLPPQPPPPPVFLPGDKADHIYGVWQSMLQEKGGLPPAKSMVAVGGIPDPAATQAKQDTYMRFRAVVDAYRLLGAPAMMPPGTPQGDPMQGGQPGGPLQAPNPALGGGQPNLERLSPEGPTGMKLGQGPGSVQ